MPTVVVRRGGSRRRRVRRGLPKVKPRYAMIVRSLRAPRHHGRAIMTAQSIASSIQLIIAPVVMVTACAILINGLLTHYANINDRLRLMARERLDLLRLIRDEKSAAPGVDSFTVERLDQIDREMPELLQRHGLVRNALLALYVS